MSMADHRPKSETGRDESSSVSSSMREGPPANAVDTLARGLQIGGACQGGEVMLLLLTLRFRRPH